MTIIFTDKISIDGLRET